MRRTINIVGIVLIGLMSHHMAIGQSDGISPLSSIGMGDFYDTNFIPVSLGGGLAAAYNDPYRSSIANPASLGHLTATSFEFGVSGQWNTLTENNSQATIRSGQFSYVSLAIPLINPINELLENRSRKLRWGAQIALVPYTNVSYEVSNSVFVAGSGTVRSNLVGDGNSYKLLMNHGFKRKNTSFGVSLGLLLGGISLQETLDLSDQPRARSTFMDNNYSISGFLWNLGVQHDIYFNRPEGKQKLRESQIPKLTVGLTVHANNSFNTTAVQQTFSQSSFGLLDTVNSVVDIKGNGTLPAEFNVGFNYYSGKKWSGGANIYYGKWSSYDNDGASTTTGELANPLVDSYRISLGGSYVPNRNSIRNLFSRSKYKFGVFFGTDSREFEGDQIAQYGVNLGVELPFIAPRNFSFVNIGAEYGKSDIDALGNTYFKINLGLTFNSNQWFIKRKYN